MTYVSFQSNESRAINSILYMVVLQLKIAWWLIKWTIRLITFGIVWVKSKQTELVDIHQESRFEHMLVLAGSGHGKTQTLQHLLTNDIPEVEKGNQSVIVIDSQGDMIKNILRLKTLAPPCPEVTVQKT